MVRHSKTTSRTFFLEKKTREFQERQLQSRKKYEANIFKAQHNQVKILV